jgi:hypothetical protein
MNRRNSHSETSVREESAALRGRRRPHHMVWMRHGAAVFLAALREIFDESAYTRFLNRNQIASSSAAYARFLREQGAAKVRRFCCC